MKKTAPMLRATVVIPTYNRPDDLDRCLGSILTQTRLPDEIIVVDDGNLPAPPRQEAFARAGIAYHYLKKDRPGLARSKNLGASRAAGDIVCYIDDDQVLEPDYLAELLKVFEEDREGRIGGVGGVFSNWPPLRPRDRLRLAYELLFCITGRTEGRLLPSGFATNYGDWGTPPRGRRYPVEFFSGGVCAFRRQVFDHLRFSPGYRESAIGEDKDFSYQVSRRYPLWVTTDARQAHYPSPSMRPDHRRAAERFILGRYIFFARHVRRRWYHPLCFWYAVTGYTLARLAAIAVFPNRRKWRKLRGHFDGLAKVLSGEADRMAEAIGREQESAP